jgi:hypothetical protein
MSLWWLLTIICVVATIPFIIWAIKSQGDSLGAMFGGITFICLVIVFFCIAIVQPISIKKELLRQEKERQQILYQIDNMNENSDKVKLNEWILTYNDWVNDVNTSKEVYGWASWYYSVDMSEHTIIELV